MNSPTNTPIPHGKRLELSTKPDFARCLERIESWFHRAVIDRPPIRFYKHNAQFDTGEPLERSRWFSLEQRWFDTDYQLDSFEQSIAGKVFYAETFPLFFPNLGPSVYSAFYAGRQIRGRGRTHGGTRRLHGADAARGRLPLPRCRGGAGTGSDPAGPALGQLLRTENEPTRLMREETGSERSRIVAIVSHRGVLMGSPACSLWPWSRRFSPCFRLDGGNAENANESAKDTAPSDTLAGKAGDRENAKKSFSDTSSRITAPVPFAISLFRVFAIRFLLETSPNPIAPPQPPPSALYWLVGRTSRGRVKVKVVPSGARLTKSTWP